MSHEKTPYVPFGSHLTALPEAPALLSAERLAAPRLTPTQARKALLNGIIRARIGTKASPIPNNDLQNVVELLTYQEAHVTAQAAALQAAEARAAEAEAQVAMLRVELAEQERELSYERQMRQQTEEAMVKLAGRVKEQTAELAEQEVQKLALIKDYTALAKHAGLTLQRLIGLAQC